LDWRNIADECTVGAACTSASASRPIVSAILVRRAANSSFGNAVVSARPACACPDRLKATTAAATIAVPITRCVTHIPPERE
jgi:hypothetical protein